MFKNKPIRPDVGAIDTLVGLPDDVAFQIRDLAGERDQGADLVALLPDVPFDGDPPAHRLDPTAHHHHRLGLAIEPVDDLLFDVDVEVEVEQTQLDDYSPSHPPPSYKLTGVPFTPEEVRRFAGGGFTSINRRHLSRIEMEDIAALQEDLFGAGNN